VLYFIFNASGTVSTGAAVATGIGSGLIGLLIGMGIIIFGILKIIYG